MNMLRWLPLWITGFLLINPGNLLAQPPEARTTVSEANILREKSVKLKANTVAAASDFGETSEFPNINTREYYEDEKRLQRIRKLEKAGEEIDDLRELDQALDSYIKRFGIVNFRKDIDLVWLAGRVKHLLGDTAKAVFYYELAQLHNFGTPAPKLTYDSLVAESSSEWLPIDQYYSLLEVRKKIDPLIPPKKVLENMGPVINSRDADYAPYMHPTDSVLIFTSRRDTTGAGEDYIDPFYRPNEDLYLSIKDFMTGEWQQATRLPNIISSGLNEGSACLSPDGKILYFTRCNAKKGHGDCDLYWATFDGTEWSRIRNLGKNINTSFWESQPNISADGKTLFFASNRKGSFGGTDIYYTTLGPDSTWSKARNLGPVVNTPKHEVTPFFHPINQSLYFSSTGHLKNFGGYDIFKARWMGDQWDAPQNVGPLVNTPGNEYYFSINGPGTTIFYSNSKDPEKDHIKQNFDLYSFPMPMEARPDAIAELKGYLVDSVSGHPLIGTVMIIDLDNGIEIAPKKINERGYFEFDLKNDNKYRIYVLGDNFLTIKEDFVMTGDTTFSVFTQSFEENKPIVFEALEFATNSTQLRSRVKPKLDYIIRFLQTYPMFKLEVEGHTDSDGGQAANYKLSLKRAQSIAFYITREGGFEEGKVKAAGFGETRPLVPNDSEENKRKNRRVEFKLMLDESYEGDLWLPTEEELFFDDSLDDELPFEDEFDYSDEEDWLEELELDDDLDLDKELEEDILLDVSDDDDDDGDGDGGDGGDDGGKKF